MVSGYYEYRLKELNDLISICNGHVTDDELEELKHERDSILYELRHIESLPKQYNK
ncbi:hypothetical protein PXD04_10365 [Methanosphaera sp. ISO3-F5]|uniref:hypothetical protein n=1 Tax=Methanosphaera sp. ISO3-F5 TaxID=1452353 RepID=UPI002B25AD29|nr:hypothetical protein [Methanosphaera sp. ISO3-F5]WQH64094.1 hypothetical protein PXD04_10365 [Methanosphaera sp. ISO3-F5]